MPKIIFVENGKNIEVNASNGQSVMEAAIQNGVDIEAACEGSLACATCHLICAEDWYNKLPEKKAEEDEMLDFAFDVTPTSRLSCQIKVTDELDQIKFYVPEE